MDNNVLHIPMLHPCYSRCEDHKQNTVTMDGVFFAEAGLTFSRADTSCMG